MAKVAFCCDLFGHLNTLNEQLQGWKKKISDLVKKLEAFQRKLYVFLSDLGSGKLLHVA